MVHWHLTPETPIQSVKGVKYSNLHHSIVHNSESGFGCYLGTWSNLLSIIRKKDNEYASFSLIKLFLLLVDVFPFSSGHRQYFLKCKVCILFILFKLFFNNTFIED